MTEIVTNYVINTGQAVKGIKEINENMKIGQDYAQIWKEKSDQAFKPDKIQTYKTSLEQLKAELKGQEQVIKDTQESMIQLNNTKTKYYQSLKQDLNSAKLQQQQIKQEIQQTELAMKNVHSTGQRLQGVFSNLAITIGAAFSVAAITAFMKKSAEYYLEAQKEEQKLKFALGERSGITEKLIKYAKELQDKTIIPKDAIIAQEAFLAAQGLTEKQIKKTILAAANFSALSGLPFETSVMNIQRTFERGVIDRGMSGFIGKHKELTEEQIKAGAVVEILLRDYNNFAENIGNTDYGKIEKAKNQWKEFREALGKSWALTTAKGASELTKELELINKAAEYLGVSPITIIWRSYFKSGYIDNILSKIDKAEKDSEVSLESMRTKTKTMLFELHKLEDYNKEQRDKADADAAKQDEKHFNLIKSNLEKRLAKEQQALDEWNANQIKSWEDWQKNMESSGNEIEKHFQDIMKQYDNLNNFIAKNQIAINKKEAKNLEDQKQNEIDAINEKYNEKIATSKGFDEQIIKLNEQRDQELLNTDTKYQELTTQLYLKSAGDIFNALSNFSTNLARLAKENTDLYRTLALVSILTSGAEALAGGIASVSKSGTPWYEKLAGYITIAASIASIMGDVYSMYNSAPGYAEGVIDIKGGRKGKDSIPSMLMPGESVMTEKETMQNKGLLMAIRQGKRDEYIAANFMNQLNIEKINEIFNRKTNSLAENIAKQFNLKAEFDQSGIYELRRKVNRTNELLELIVGNTQLTRAKRKR